MPLGSNVIVTIFPPENVVAMGTMGIAMILAPQSVQHFQVTAKL